MNLTSKDFLYASYGKNQNGTCVLRLEIPWMKQSRDLIR